MDSENLMVSKERYEWLINDFTQYRSTANKEIERLKLEAYKDPIVKLLPIIDDLKCSIDSGNEDNQLILNNALKSLETLGVKPYCNVGDEFDSALHNCVGTDRNFWFKDYQITQIIMDGFKLNDEVIRKADVIICKI